MTLTKQWINNQIAEYTTLLTYITDHKDDDLLRAVYKQTVNTLDATLRVIKLEETIQ